MSACMLGQDVKRRIQLGALMAIAAILLIAAGCGGSEPPEEPASAPEPSAEAALLDAIIGPNAEADAAIEQILLMAR